MKNQSNIAVIHSKTDCDLLSVSWDTSSICNYKCSYCSEDYNGGKNKFPPIDKVLKFLNELSSQSGKKLFLEIKGGEPTFWKDLPMFLKVCDEKQWGTCLVTNGSSKLKWWKENLANIADVNISLHTEYFDLESMIEKIKYINKRRYLTVKYMMIPELFDECVRRIEVIREEIPSASVQAFYLAKPKKDGELYEYTEYQKNKIEELNQYKKKFVKRIWKAFPFEDRNKAWSLDSRGVVEKISSQKLKINNQNLWKEWVCFAGIERVHIGSDGAIFRGQCKQGGKIGSLYDTWTLPTEGVICKKEICFCGSELLLTKWKREDFSLVEKNLEIELGIK